MKIFKKNAKIATDSKGILFSTDFLLTLLLFVIVIGIIANIIDSSNEKVLNPLEVAELERLTNIAVDNLLNNPGSPSHWENMNNFQSVIPGLAIEYSNNEGMINTVSFKKLEILNSNYNNLIENKLFNNRVKSSIALYPMDCGVDSIFIGDSINNFNENASNIVVVNRTVKCDFYRELAILSVKNGDEFSYKNLDNNRNYCNHEAINNLNHSNDNGYSWICREFKITRNNFQNNDYYLLFNNESIHNGNYWFMDNINNLSSDVNISTITNEKIDLNNYFSEVLENESSMIFYIHFKVKNTDLKDFNCVLVGINDKIDINTLNIDYFKEQVCNFVMMTSY